MPVRTTPRVPGASDAPDEVDLRLQVARHRVAADGVVVLDLQPVGDTALPAWEPGAHIDLRLPNGLVRQYSLAGDPEDRRSWRIGVLREQVSRGGSEYLHTSLHEGDEVEVRGPRNSFALQPSPHYIFIAGGIGVTPIVPMIRRASRDGATWDLHYGGRSRRSMAFLDELGALECRNRGRVHIYPFDEVGLIDLPAALGAASPDTLVYACGPEPLLAAIEAYQDRWPSGSLRFERFRPRDLGNAAPAESFEVVLAGSGLTLEVPPDKSILQVVDEAGVPVMSSCTEGTCGTCETAVIEGQVDHRDSVLSAAERASNTTMCICVSRAVGPRLVLDL